MGRLVTGAGLIGQLTAELDNVQNLSHFRE
jgi:hypothetical protein